uniref:Uncharacterized protein n=1 Tax=Lactuca sativa TaxID=4236 RepID=A0A9R1XBX8_LACSA|nr:hypothetical protein LSAT_V11C400187690 [Lactuca sativa]
MALHSLVLNPEDTTTTTTITKPIEELSTMVKPDQALYLITLKAHRFTMVLLPHLWTIFLQLDFPCLLQSNRLTFFLILLMEGIAPDSMHDYEQGENTDDEKKSIRQQLISCYETRLKTDVCDLDVGNYNPGKETLPRNCVESEQWCTSKKPGEIKVAKQAMLHGEIKMILMNIFGKYSLNFIKLAFMLKQLCFSHG